MKQSPGQEQRVLGEKKVVVVVVVVAVEQLKVQAEPQARITVMVAPQVPTVVVLVVVP